MPTRYDEETISRSAYLTGRAVVTALLVLLYISGTVHIDNVAAGRFGASIGILILSNIIVLVAGQRPRAHFDRLLWTMLPLDLLALALLVGALHRYEDPAFPIFVGITLAYSAMSHRRYGWLAVAVSTSITYLLSHVTSDGAHTWGQTGFLLMNMGIITFFAYMVSSGLRRQTERENEVRQAQADVLQLNSQMQRRLTELQAVSQISEVIHSTLDFDSVGSVVIDIIQRVIDIPASSLFVIDKARAETLFSASKGGADYGPTVGVTQILEDDDMHFSCMSVLDRDEVMVVFCAATEALQSMKSEDKLVLQTIASELVVAVENSRLYKLTKRMAITDELTSLYNYRYLQQRLDEEVERARRYEKSLSLLMIDVDEFKLFNDTHGHLAGDKALAALGRVMRSCVREVDVVARYGGEEFSILLPETDEPGAYVVAEKVREAVADHRFVDGDQEPTHLTVSIGLAAMPVHAADKETLLQQADEALYQAKHFGKNRVRSPRKETFLDRDSVPGEAV